MTSLTLGPSLKDQKRLFFYKNEKAKEWCLSVPIYNLFFVCASLEVFI